MLPDTLIDNRYRIIKSIGQGGMSDVYLANDEYLSRPVSLKMLRLDLQNNPEALLRFDKEATAAAELIHPNVVQMYDVGEFEGQKYIALEYVDGMDLKAYIAKNFPIPYQQVLDIMGQILGAVQAAHDANIIHRDLKPKNILINTDNQIKITDFGIAVSSDDAFMATPNEVLGSVHYLSPEQISGEEASIKSDIYALGVMLYELLEGKVPYEGQTAEIIAAKHTSDEIPSLRDFDPRIPQALENVVLRATAKNPIDRYLSADEMAVDLATSLSPRRADEKRFAPLLSQKQPQELDDQTRIIPIDQLHDQLNTGIATDVPDNGADTKQDSDPVLTELLNMGREGYYVDDIAKHLDKPVGFVENLLAQNGLPVYHKQKKKRLWPLVVVMILLAIIAGLLAYKIFVPSPKALPNLSNLSQTEAKSRLTKLGFQIGNTVNQASKQVKAGEVIETDPPAGTKLNKGDVVKLIVSTGEETVSFGYYIGQNYNAIASQLTDRGFKVEKKEINDATVAEGNIIDQSITPQTSVSTDSTVVFTVSKGPAQVEMPDFTGHNLADVQAWASTNQINLVQNPVEGAAPKDTIVRQYLLAGSYVTPGDAKVSLKIDVSTGPKEATETSSSASSTNDSKDTSTAKSDSADTTNKNNTTNK